MSDEKKAKPPLMDRVAEFLASPDGLSRDEVRTYLANEGVDLKGLGNRHDAFMARAHKAQRKSLMDDARKRMSTAAAEFVGKASKYTSMSRQQLILQVQRLAQGAPVQAFFRELTIEAMPDDEIRQLLAQLEDTPDADNLGIDEGE